MIALTLFVIVFWLSQPEDVLKADKIAAKLSDAFDSSTRKKPQDETKEEADQPAETEKKYETTVEEAIYAALKKLHIDEKNIRRRKKDDQITYTVPVNPYINDLIFANMIIKGEVETSNGIFNSGLEQGRRQILTFTDKENGLKHIVELFYKRDEKALGAGSRTLAIIVDDFGNYSGSLLTAFAKTNPAVNFAIMPHTPHAVEAMKLATQYGLESIIHVPMEPRNFPQENPGDHAIFIQLSEGEITRRMERFINQLPDCIGANNHMGSLATADESTMQAVMQTLKKHDLLFVDSRTTSSSVAYTVAQKNLVPAFKRDIFLDEPDLSDGNLNKKIAECISLSQSRPFVIAIMHCKTEAHLKYLNSFIAKAEQAGFELMPLSQLGAYRLPEIP
ncbi:MAG: divergent polysaccharide deacetylase family protein [Candidatus Cloacimonadaceae bacterium]